MKNSNLNPNKISSFLELNIPRKINYNNSFNKSIIDSNNDKFKTLKKQKFRKVSKFNPYDIGYLKLNYKDSINKTGIKSNHYKDLNYINKTNNESINKENESIKSNILIQKDNKYLNSNKKCSQNLMSKFNTPKTGMNLGINKNTPEYLIKIKNQKNQYFTDLKKALNNLKIKSTNYSSNASYNFTENNYYDGHNDKVRKVRDSSFNKKIKKINIHKSNKQFCPKALKTLEKILKIKSRLKLQSKDKKNRIRENKSANNFKITNQNKYITIGNTKVEKIDVNILFHL